LIGGASGALGAMTPPSLAVWHGLNTALIASLVALSIGLLAHIGRDRLQPLLERGGGAVPEATVGYRGALEGLNATADRVTALAQPGTLPVYAGVILVVASALPLG